MYEYTFVETSLGGFFSEATHQQTIIDYAREGWRLVQVLPTNIMDMENQHITRSSLKD